MDVEFVLHEENEIPVFCPLLTFLALAFADGVFLLLTGLRQKPQVAGRDPEIGP